jgi:hypothetical protein
MSYPLIDRGTLARVGDLRQLAGVDLVESIDGPERGVRQALVRSGAGLEFAVNIDRGFDLGDARLNGVPLAWRSPAGAVHPHAFQDDAKGWLRRFPGGLLTTCGLDNAGPASGGRPFHGRASQAPARLLANRTLWEGERCRIELVGEAQDYRLFGDYLVLTRTIGVECGTNRIRLKDVIENRGERRSPMMLYYHCNFGYPLLDESARLLIASRVSGLGAEAERDLDSHALMHGPVRGLAEQVFRHDVDAGEDGLAQVHLVNPRLPAAVTLRYDKTRLPHFLQWKNLAEGAYVLGLEPCNCGPFGFERENEEGRVVWLEPGEGRTLELELSFAADGEAVSRLLASGGGRLRT